METLLTAEEFLDKHRDVTTDFDYETSQMMIKFAKMHVEKALKEASEKAVMIEENYKGFCFENQVDLDDYTTIKVHKESILNAYSLDKIK